MTQHPNPFDERQDAADPRGPGIFQIPAALFGLDRPGLYSHAPLRAALIRAVDFGRLNDGAVRFTVSVTDLASDEAVAFDTARGDWIGVDPACDLWLHP